MPSFADLIAQGSAHAWLFIPSAILLGALHGLEPGHSKTMMAAFIVAVRGTVGQAVLLGLAATVSHTFVVWGIAIGGMYLWRGVDAETFEPYFQLASAAIIISIALWMLWRTWQDQQAAKAAAGHSHDDHHHGSHSHGEDIRRIDTGHGVMAIEVFEDGVPPREPIRTGMFFAVSRSASRRPVLPRRRGRSALSSPSPPPPARWRPMAPRATAPSHGHWPT